MVCPLYIIENLHYLHYLTSLKTFYFFAPVGKQTIFTKKNPNFSPLNIKWSVPYTSLRIYIIYETKREECLNNIIIACIYYNYMNCKTQMHCAMVMSLKICLIHNVQCIVVVP